jgi:hypothetical protein
MAVGYFFAQKSGRSRPGFEKTSSGIEKFVKSILKRDK